MQFLVMASGHKRHDENVEEEGSLWNDHVAAWINKTDRKEDGFSSTITKRVSVY